MLPEKPWKLDSVVRLFLGVMTTLCMGMLLASLLGRVISDWPKGWLLIFNALILEIPALVWIALFLRLHNIGWMDAFGLCMANPAKAGDCGDMAATPPIPVRHQLGRAGKAAAFGFLAAAIFVPAAWLLQMLSEKIMLLVHLNPQAQATVQELQDPDLSVTGKVIMGVLMVVFAPIVEETLFRGILYPALKQQCRPRWALWGSSALFAAVHTNMVTFLPLLVFALLLVYLYETFENLLAPIAAHSLFNATNFLILIFSDKIDRALHLT